MNISAEGHEVFIFVRLSTVLWIGLVVAHVVLAWLATRRIRFVATAARNLVLIAWLIPILGPLHVLWRYRAPPQPPLLPPTQG